MLTMNAQVLNKLMCTFPQVAAELQQVAAAKLVKDREALRQTLSLLSAGNLKRCGSFRELAGKRLTQQLPSNNSLQLQQIRRLGRLKRQLNAISRRVQALDEAPGNYALVN